MKKYLLSGIALTMLTGAASAADLPRRAAPPPVYIPPPAFTWTGIYIGTHTSYAWSENDRIATSGNTLATMGNVTANRRPASIGRDTDAFALLGGTVGANYQFQPGSGLVMGVAFSADYLDLHKNTIFSGEPVAGAPATARNPSAFYQELGWLGTANGRFGYAWDRLLIYGTGGLAFGGVEYSSAFYNPAGALQFSGTYGDVDTGYNYGGGFEYAIPKDSLLGKFDLLALFGINLGGTSTLKAEYIKYDLGSRHVIVNAIPGVGTGSYTSRFNTEGSIVRAGFNYKFP